MSTSNQYFHLHDKALVAAIKAGAVGVLPTDTVYGLVASAALPSAVAKLYQLKHREAKPGTLVAASIEQLVALGFQRRYLTAVAQFWPNAISVVIPTEPTLRYLNFGVGSQAVRIPGDADFRELLEQTGPLLTTSANLPNQPTANTVAEATAYFGDQPDYYVDGGNLSGRPASTVIRMIDDAIEVLRQGAVTIDEEGRIG